MPSPSKFNDDEQKNDDDGEEGGEESQKKKKKRRKNKKKKKKGAKLEGVDITAIANANAGGDETHEKAYQNDDDNGQDNDSAASAEDLDFEEDLKQFSLRLQATQQQSSMLSS